MNSLLHSRRFKKNLFKWLLMYGISLGMLTMVVTYSRFITTYTSTDVARPAKFALDFAYSRICDGQESGTACDLGSIRPEEYLEYDFNIDATKGEVDTIVVADIMIDDNFEFVSLLPVSGNNMSYNLLDNGIEFKGTMPKGTKNTYKIKLRYKGYNTDAYKAAINYDSILKVDYSATQDSN